MKRKNKHAVKKTHFSRRDFIHKSMTVPAAAAIGFMVKTNPVFGSSHQKPKPISPGYVGPQYYDEMEKNELEDVLKSGSPFRFWGSKKPRKSKSFEDRFAKYMDSPYALAVNAGTSALNSAIAGLGIGPGDEVIVPAYSWWSDYTCVVNAGALPVFADIDKTFNLDPKDFERKITPRTKAVLAVHLMGGLCDIEPILAIAEKHGVKVLEDCAQCVGGSYQGKKLGSLGDVGIYSFQVNKMMSAGEGGAVVTANPVIYERASRFHDVGIFRSVFQDRTGSSSVKHFPGENYRMNEFSAAVLGAQLSKLDRMVGDQRRNANRVHDGIKDLPGIKFRRQPDPKGDTGYCVGFELANKDAQQRCIRELHKRGIPAGTLGGSVLLPVQESVINKHVRHPNWTSFNTPEGKAIQYGKESCRQTLQIYDTFVLVRIGPKYTDKENERIIAAVREVYPMVKM